MIYMFCTLFFFFNFGLKFYSPVNTVKVMSSQSVYLITHLLGLLSPLSSWSSICHPLARKTTYSVCMVLLLLSLLLLFRCYSLVEELLDYSSLYQMLPIHWIISMNSHLFTTASSLYFTFQKSFCFTFVWQAPLYNSQLENCTPYTSNT